MTVAEAIGCAICGSTINRGGATCSRTCGYKMRRLKSLSPERISARFYLQVNTNGPIPPHRPDLGPCHIWTGRVNAKGYGMFGFSDQEERAHRVAFFLAEGRWPDPFGLHHCDNPPCVRRSHLFEGTIRDNTIDMVSKGRHWMIAHPERILSGEANGFSKLTEAAVREIRASNETLIVLARRFNVTEANVSMVRLRKTWKHVS